MCSPLAWDLFRAPYRQRIPCELSRFKPLTLFLFLFKLLSTSWRPPIRSLTGGEFFRSHLVFQLTLEMAYQAPPAVCTLPAYETFIPLSGFVPALGYCSTTALLNKKTDQVPAIRQLPGEVQCPAGESRLCDLLSELKASDREFARGVWYVRLD